MFACNLLCPANSIDSGDTLSCPGWASGTWIIFYFTFDPNIFSKDVQVVCMTVLWLVAFTDVHVYLALLCC